MKGHGLCTAGRLVPVVYHVLSVARQPIVCVMGQQASSHVQACAVLTVLWLPLPPITHAACAVSASCCPTRPHSNHTSLSSRTTSCWPQGRCLILARPTSASSVTSLRHCLCEGTPLHGRQHTVFHDDVGDGRHTARRAHTQPRTGTHHQRLSAAVTSGQILTAHHSTSQASE